MTTRRHERRAKQAVVKTQEIGTFGGDLRTGELSAPMRRQATLPRDSAALRAPTAPTVAGPDAPTPEPPSTYEPPARPDGISPRSVKFLLMVADIFAVFIAMVVATLLFGVIDGFNDRMLQTAAVLEGALLPVMVVSMVAANLYTARANSRPTDEVRNILRAAAFGIAGMIGVAFAFDVDNMSRRWVALLFVSLVTALCVERSIARSAFRRLRRERRMARRVVVVGGDAHAVELAKALERGPELGYDVVGAVTEGMLTPDPGLDVPVLVGYDGIEDFVEDHGASSVIISLYSVGGDVVNQLSRRLTDAGVHVSLCTTLEDIDVPRIRAQELDGRVILYIEATIRTGWRRLAKRAFDLAVAVTGLVLTAPIMLGAILAIKLDSRGPVFFRQERVGLDGEAFPMIKLRTMVADAEARKQALLEQNEVDGPLFKMKRDPRITRVGRFLRKTSIDELPQFWNVIRGEMSIVGPRPALASEAEEWESGLRDRLRVLPGITGMWQVSGRSDSSFEQYKRLDLYYVDNWSLMHDVRIVLRTVGVVLFGRGAS
ncbi:MAG: sugar transferase [Actinomycetota bacterium]